MSNEEDRPELKKAMADIRKAVGKHAIVPAIKRVGKPIQRISTGVFGMDRATGGGLPRGRIIMFWGESSSGKTTDAQRVVAQAQNLCSRCCAPVKDLKVVQIEGTDEWKASATCACGDYKEFLCAYIDVEGTFDGIWAQRVGVDLRRLLFSRPETAEQAIDIVDTLVRTGDVDMIIVDSIAALTPSTETEESVVKWQQGLQARLTNKAWRKFNSAMLHVENQTGDEKRRPTIIVINQIRMKITMYGNPETRPGGEGQKFATSVEIKVSKGKPIMDEDDQTPLFVVQEYLVNKNKVGVPMRGGEYRIAMGDFGTKRMGDVVDEEELVNVAIKFGVVKKMNAKGEVDANGRSCFVVPTGRKHESQSLLVKHLMNERTDYELIKVATIEAEKKAMNATRSL